MKAIQSITTATLTFAGLAGAVFAPLTAVAQPSAVSLQIESPSDFARPDEVVSIEWSTLLERLPAAAEAGVRAVDPETGLEIPSQRVDNDGDGSTDELLILVDLWPHETRKFDLEAAAPTTEYDARVYAYHDEYRDDLAWESDRIAFRMYGQGLWTASEFDPLVSSGVDVWPKRVRDLVIDRWYGKGHDAYHLDTGEGADFFSVGPTLGAGGTAVWRDGEMFRARNFKTYRILANGPIRTIFELNYEPWDTGGIEVSETKRITIDAGQNLFRAESTFESDDEGPVPYVVGFVKRAEGIVGSTRRLGDWAWLSVWGPVERKNGGHGELGSAVLMRDDRLEKVKETADHYLAFAKATSGVPTVQYVGSGWTASGDFDTVEDWWAYLDRFAARLESPVVVTFGQSE